MPPRRKSVGKRSKIHKYASKKDKEEFVDIAQQDALLFNELQQDELRENKIIQDMNKELETKKIEHEELYAKFSDLNTLNVLEKHSKWDMKCWENYLHKSRDINPLVLCEVNAYLTELDEDDDYDILHVFKICRESQKMCEDIKLALLECPKVPYKTTKSWLESIKCLHCMMRKKIEIATFLILRTAHEFVSDESFNMEYAVIDDIEDGGLPPIILCLWGNLSKNIRHKGMTLSSIGFSFELPPELLKISCAVRILHTLFDNVTPMFCESALSYQWKLGEYSEELHYGLILIDEIFPVSDALEENISDQFDSKALIEMIKQISSEQVPKKSEAEKNSSIIFTPPEEPEITVVNKMEYFVVGGLYHFDLFQLPYPTVRSGCWIFTNWEDKVLKHIPYKTSIIPIRHPKPDMSPAVAAEFADSEIKRFDKEMCSAISVLLQLPNDTLFLEQPTPAFWIPSLKGFSTIGFFETKYDEDTGRVSFKTNQFGIIGLLQRKYNNVPYQSWDLVSNCGLNSSVLTITGMHVAIQIEISQDKCSIQKIEQDGKELFTNSYSVWMSPEELVKKLLSMGINIIIEKDIHKYIEVSPKNVEFENLCYSCMAISSHAFNFYWSRWNAVVGPDQIVLKYNTRETSNEVKFNHVLLTPDKALEIKCTETSAKFSDEPIEGQKYCSNLYHLLMHKNDQPESELDYKFANCIFYLLRTCKLFSCS